MQSTHLKILVFILLTTISTPGYSQLKNPMKEKQQKEEAARKAAEAEKARQQKARVLAAINSYEMVYIAGGTFTMGSTDGNSDEKPTHRVTVSSFRMGATEVTQALWKAVMGSNPSYFKGDNLPVESVSWNDCQSFIRKLNQLTGKSYRLPTEAEWEYAAGGGEDYRTKWAGTDNESSLGDYAWYYANSGSTTHTVATKSPNRLGLYDMSGNVYEWCSDWKGDYSSNSQTNPTGASSGSIRVSRGCSWFYRAQYCRSASRHGGTPVNRYNDLGLRLVSPK